MFARFWMILTVLMVLTSPVIGDEIRIASWNIQQFGQTKTGIKPPRNPNNPKTPNHRKNKTLSKISKIIKEGEFDLIAIQEVQDKERRTLPKLLLALGEKNWKCVESKRTGGNKKEQYAIFFNPRKLRLKLQSRWKGNIHLYNGWDVRMERLPGYCSFETIDGSFDFTIITFHNRPWRSEARKEAKFLDNIYDRVQKELGAADNDILLLGDFNIKDDYESHFDELIGKGFKNAICFGEDTMLSGNDSTLDNIFYLQNKDLDLVCSDVLEFNDSDKFGEGYDKKISDHYPVWATFGIQDDDDK